MLCKLLYLGKHRFVIFFLSKLEHCHYIVIAFTELFVALYYILIFAYFLRNFLRIFYIVPEIRLCALFFELYYFCFEIIKVKCAGKLFKLRLIALELNFEFIIF